MEYKQALDMAVGDKVVIKGTKKQATITDIQKVREGYYPAVYFFCNDGKKHYYSNVEPSAV